MATITYEMAIDAGNVGRHRLLTEKAGQIAGFTFINKLFAANTAAAFVGAFFDHCDFPGVRPTLLTKKCQKCRPDPSFCSGISLRVPSAHPVIL